MVKVAGPGQTVGLLQFQVQEEHLDPVARRQADGPVAPDIVGVGARVLRAGEVAPHCRVHLLAFSWIGESRSKGATVRRVETVIICNCSLGSRLKPPWQVVGTMQKTRQLIPKTALNCN